MNRKLKLMTFIALAAILPRMTASGKSQELMSNVQFLNITLKNSEVSLALANKPMMTYDSDVLSFYTVGESFQVPVADVQGWYFSETPTAIKQYETAKAQVVQGTAYLANLKPGSNVSVYNVKGEQMRSATANEQGEAILEFVSLPKGVYLLKTPDYTIKITNK